MTVITPDWPAPSNVKAYTTTRHVWGHNDSRLPAERESLKELFNLPQDPVWLKQVHGTTAVEATPDKKETSADASYTQTSGQVCVILTADCLPILICDQSGNSIANIHAGWRGLAGGIIEQTLDCMCADSQNLMVWLGPAIGPEKFEVGEDVFTAFTSSHKQAVNAFKPHTADKWHANLYALAKIRFAERGIRHIYGGNFCTHTQSDLFFSYRRDQGKTGRMATVIWLESK